MGQRHAAACRADSTAQGEAYATFAKKIVADAPAFFLYTPRYHYYIEKGLQGIAIDTLAGPADRFAGVRDWYSKKHLAWR